MPLNHETRFRQASLFLREGRLVQAEAICRDILARVPGNAAAIHLLGLIRKEAGDSVGGERLLLQSIALEPSRSEFRANLANLQRRLGRLSDAERSYREALARDPSNTAARLGLARTLNDLGRPSAAEEHCRVLVGARPRDPQAWTALAMTLRDQQKPDEAEAAYRKAIEVDPAHGPAYHNLGSMLSRAARAEEAMEALNRAQANGVQGFELAFNRAQTLLQLYRIDEAEQEYARAVALNPAHPEAQINLARIRFMRRDPDFARDIVRAAQSHPDDSSLQMLLAIVLRRAGAYAQAESLLRATIARIGPLPALRASLGEVLHETGRLAQAQEEALAAVKAMPDDPLVNQGLVSVMLARGRADEALPFIRRQRELFPWDQGWIAYEATAARVLDLPLYRELYDYDRFVRTYDLEPPPGWSSMQELNMALLRALEARHQFATHPLDQSLRNGSQTARNLIADPDPAIKAILQAFEPAIESYRAAMGTDAGHALSARNRSPARITGAWSVQLRRDGFHVNHFHPEGWISSAYYVGVPAEVRDQDLRSGWIKFGEPRFPVPGATAQRYVQPASGRLVLFPSYLWHGTNPIHGAEPRTTIAFDASPRGESPPRSADPGNARAAAVGARKQE